MDDHRLALAATTQKGTGTGFPGSEMLLPNRYIDAVATVIQPHMKHREQQHGQIGESWFDLRPTAVKNQE